jgi:hypothetical protein
LIARAARTYGHQVAFLGIAADDTRSAAVSFLRTHPLGFPSFQATLDLRPLLPRALPGIPVTLYMSPDGQPVDVHIGEYASFATLAHDIDAFSLHTRSASPSNGKSLWYGAPHDQPGAWRNGGATVCPLAPPNRYLPARAGCVSVAFGDVVGDGQTDLILLYGLLSTRPGAGGYYASRFTLEVRRPNGATLRTPIQNAETAPTILGGRDVNNRRGMELFIREAAISSGQTAGVYTFDGNAIRHVGDFSYGGDSAVVQGFSCRVGPPATITQRVYLLEGPSRTGVWQRTDTTYTWAGPNLRRTTERTTHTHGIPPSSQQQAVC